MSNIFTQEDCMDLMARYPNKYFDLLISDPLYGINQGGDKNHTRDGLANPKLYKCFNDSKPMGSKSFYI